MGDSACALPEGGHGAAARGELGERRRGARVDLYKRLLGDLPGVHDAARGARAAARSLRLAGRGGQRPAPQDPRPGAPRLARRLSR